MKHIILYIKKIIAFLMFVLESCITAISEDLQLLAFLLIVTVPDIIIKIRTDMPIFNLRSLLFNFAWFCLIVALSYNYKTKRSRTVYLCVMTTIVYLLTYSNLLYYQFYEDFLSLSLIKQLSLFFDVADATAVKVSTFDFYYWFIFALIFILLIIVSRLFKREHQNLETRNFNRLNFLRLALFAFITGILMLAPANYSQAQKFWNRPIVVQDFGLFNYHILDIYQSLGVFINHTPSEEEYTEFLAYISERNGEKIENEYTNILQGKNIIVIHAESIENFLINQKVYDVEGNLIEITPNINRLANEGLYFSNFYSQQSIGTSADSEFVFNTSLLPVNNGTIFMTHFDHKYVTTQSLLKEQGYQTLYMHGNNGSFWNRNTMYPILGYDTFYDKKAYEFDEEQEIGLGINDDLFFQQSIEYLAQTEAPYWATLITLTNHTPWAEIDKYITKDEMDVVEPAIDCATLDLYDPNGEKDATTCRYLKSARYSDWALGRFLDELEDRGMLDNTAIVLYGDHPAKLPLDEMELFYEAVGLYEDMEMSSLQYATLAHVPFIIWDKAIEHREVDTIMAEYDAGPTLQNMLGIKNIYALGNDIFSVENNIVPFINGNWTDGIIYYSYRDEKYHIIDEELYPEELIEKMILEDDYINKQMDTVIELINVSNMINKYDLIYFHEQKLKKERG